MVLLTAVLLCAGCQSREAANMIAETEAESEMETTPETTTIHIETEPETMEAEEPEERIEVDGKIRSYLTGEMVDVAKANRRPLAIMMSNDKESLPQYGINRAGIVYEAPVEGDMNRYMAIMEDYDDLDRIGSVRSCRTYYIFFAREFDAVYAHFGQSTFAKPYLKYIDNINGLEGIGDTAFYRSNDRKRPHNAYSSFSRIQSAIDKLGYSREYDADYEGVFQFARTGQPVEFTQPNVVDAVKVIPGYSYNNPWFEYNSEDGLYYRYQYGAAHNGSEGQISVKNILILYYPVGRYATTAYLNINVNSPSWGYYITGGKAIPINTTKDDEFGQTQYYDTNWEEITLNQGKTWICIVPSSSNEKTQILAE